MNALDFFIVGIIILSGLFAFARGFVRECLSIVAWLGATAAALYGESVLKPYAERYLPKGAVADGAAAGVAFLLTLIVLTLIASVISRGVKRSALSALDRTLGLIFGLGRGVMLVAIGFLALSFILPPKGEKPRWIRESRTAPLFIGATQAIARVLPPSMRQRIATFDPQERLNQEFENAIRAYALPAPKAPSGPQISPEDQQRFNQLLEQTVKERSSSVTPAPAPAQGQ
jgi:membrane protein required for colicin V production